MSRQLLPGAVLVLSGMLLAGLAPVQGQSVADPTDPTVGRFTGNDITVLVEPASDGYGGLIIRGYQQFPFTAQRVGESIGGQFVHREARFPFVAVIEKDTMVLKTGGRTYVLHRDVLPTPVGAGEEEPASPAPTSAEASETEPSTPDPEPAPTAPQQVARQAETEAPDPSEPVETTLVITDKPAPSQAAAASPGASTPTPVDGQDVDRVSHPAGFSVKAPTGWTSQVGPDAVLLLSPQAAGQAPSLACNIGITRDPSLQLSRPDEPGLLKQVLAGFAEQSPGFKQQGEPRTIERDWGPVVIVNYAGENARTKQPILARLHLFVLDEQTACHVLAAGDREVLARHATLLLEVIDSIRLSVEGQSPLEPVSDLSASDGPFAGQYRLITPRGVSLLTLAEAKGSVGGLLVGVQGQRSSINGVVRKPGFFVGELNYEGAIVHVEGVLKGDELVLTGVARNRATGLLDRDQAYTMTYQRVAAEVDIDQTVEAGEPGEKPDQATVLFEEPQPDAEELDAAEPAEVEQPEDVPAPWEEEDEPAERPEPMGQRPAAEGGQPARFVDLAGGAEREVTGRWTDGEIVYEIGERHIMVYRIDRPDAARVGELKLEGNLMTVTVGSDSETSRFQVNRNTLTIMMDGGAAVTLRRAG